MSTTKPWYRAEGMDRMADWYMADAEDDLGRIIRE